MRERDTGGAIVWQRQVDRAAAERRWRRLGLWFVAPATAVSVIALFAGGVGAAIGLAICFVILGVVAAFWISVLNQALELNTEIRLVDGSLADCTTSVRVADIEAWTTTRTGQFSAAKGIGSHAPTAQAQFRLGHATVGDGSDAVGSEIVVFPWPEMSARELDGIREALEPHIAAPWVPPDRIHG